MDLPVSFSITLKPSRWLIISIITLYSLSACVIAALQTTTLIRLLLLLIVIVSLMWHWRNAGRCTVIQLFPETTERQWVLVSKTAKHTDADLTGSLVYRYLVILYFQLENGGRCTILIPSDSIDEESHRRLRALLHRR